MGDYYTVNASVRQLHGLSGHADHTGLIEYLSNRNISAVKKYFWCTEKSNHKNT